MSFYRFKVFTEKKKFFFLPISSMTNLTLSVLSRFPPRAVFFKTDITVFKQDLVNKYYSLPTSEINQILLKNYHN